MLYDIRDLVDIIDKRTEAMMATLEEVKAADDELNAAIDSIATEVDALQAQVVDLQAQIAAGADPAAMQALVDSMTAKTQQIKDALVPPT